MVEEDEKREGLEDANGIVMDTDADSLNVQENKNDQFSEDDANPIPLTQRMQCDEEDKNQNRQEVNQLTDGSPNSDEENSEEDLEAWQKEGEMIPRQLLLIMFGLLMYIADIGTDIKVAIDHLQAEDYFWAMWTLILAFVPCLVMQVVSAWWFKEDKHLTPKVVIFHIFMLGPVLRYIDTTQQALSIRNNPQPNVNAYKRLVSKKLDIAMLNLFLAFMEDAPQLVLQLYIKTTLKQYDIQLTRIRDLWLVASLVLSLFSLSWSLLNYYKTLRSSCLAKVQFSGLIGIFFWRLFTVSSRVITLALFASVQKMWFFVLFALHYILMFIFIWKQKLSFFPEQPCKQKFLKSLFAYILFFSYFSIEGQKTRKWSVVFYLIIGSENIGLILLWYFQQTSFTPLFSRCVLIYVLAAFVLGVLLVMAYYTFLHPSRAVKRGKGCYNLKWKNRTLSQRRRKNMSASSCGDQHHIISGVPIDFYLSVV